jgi:hypothetical protein
VLANLLATPGPWLEAFALAGVLCLPQLRWRDAKSRPLALQIALQVGVVGWLAARGGLRLALGFVPLLLAGSLALLALVPVGAMLLATQVFRRAVDYGLFKPTREMLFTVLNPESKFKSKSRSTLTLALSKNRRHEPSLFVFHFARCTPHRGQGWLQLGHQRRSRSRRSRHW